MSLTSVRAGFSAITLLEMIAQSCCCLSAGSAPWAHRGQAHHSGAGLMFFGGLKAKMSVHSAVGRSVPHGCAV